MSKKRVATWLATLGAAVVLVFAAGQMGSAHAAQAHAAKAGKDVYVCDCMGGKSCPCMGMAKKEGKCVCGKEMKKVAADSAWAKHNRKELE